MEPGRFVVAECGALLCRVTQIKHKSGINFVGVTAGMTSLIRPPLYSAYHAICNLSQPVPGEDKDQHMIANVCGPICESGDVMGWCVWVEDAPGSGDMFCRVLSVVMLCWLTCRPPLPPCPTGNDPSQQTRRRATSWSLMPSARTAAAWARRTTCASPVTRSSCPSGDLLSLSRFFVDFTATTTGRDVPGSLPLTQTQMNTFSLLVWFASCGCPSAVRTETHSL